MEEVDEGNITKLLESLPHGLNATERMIMVNEGTVQTFLSVLCNTPVKVEVISQCEMADVIIRWSKLVIEDRGGIQTVVCLAESIIPTSDIGISNAPDFITMINDREKGIGQIIKEIGFKTITRHIKGFHSDEKTFARTYTIDGSISLVITEVFNRETIAKVSSTRANRRVAADNVHVLGPMDFGELSKLLVDLSGGVQPKKDTTGNTKVGEGVVSEPVAVSKIFTPAAGYTKVGEVVASEQLADPIKEGDSE